MILYCIKLIAKSSSVSLILQLSFHEADTSLFKLSVLYRGDGLLAKFSLRSICKQGLFHRIILLMARGWLPARSDDGD